MKHPKVEMVKRRKINKAKKKAFARPSWDEYFLGVAKEVSTRATCDRGRSGCVIVKDKRILTN